MLVGTGLFTYRNSFWGPFVFDDLPAIVENLSIRQLWPPGPVLSPPGGGTTVDARPVVNLTLAINYALGELDERGYHALNLAVHLLAGLILFGIVRRTLSRPPIPPALHPRATGLALAIALVWAVHPLLTAAVTYTIQRAESLMGLCYLATLYLVIRGAGAALPWTWYGPAIGVCAAGMGCKEVMVTAPVMVAVYDRTFLSRSWTELFQRRRYLYLGLAATWLLLLKLVLTSGGRGGSAGFGAAISSWEYLRTQFGFITRYLALSVWPHPLVFDYGTPVARSAAEIVPFALVIVLLGGLTAWAWRRRPVPAFLGTWFFAILAPSSSLIPVVTQTGGEHRMYLPLAAVVSLLAGGACLGWAALTVRHPNLAASWRRRLPLVAAGVVVATLSVLTTRRNDDYRSAVAIWEDTIRKRPGNARAFSNLGGIYGEQGDYRRGLKQVNQALALQPDLPEALNNRAVAYNCLGEPEKALADLNRVVTLKPEYGPAFNNRGNAWSLLGRDDLALADFDRAIRLLPGLATAWNNRGKSKLLLKRYTDAIPDFTAAIERIPDFAEAYYHRGTARALLGQYAASLADFSQAIRFRPEYADAFYHRGVAKSRLGQDAEAVVDFDQAIRLNPKLAEAFFQRGSAAARQSRIAPALADLTRAIGLQADYAEAYDRRGSLRARQGMLAEGLADLTRAIELRPDDSEAYNNRGNIRMLLGQIGLAVADYTRAIGLRGDNADAYRNRAAAYLSIRQYDAARADVQKLREMGATLPANLPRDLGRPAAGSPRP